MSGLDVTSGGWSSRYQPFPDQHCQASSRPFRRFFPDLRHRPQPEPVSSHPTPPVEGEADVTQAVPGEAHDAPPAAMPMSPVVDPSTHQPQQSDRIYELEQALEQALIYLDELRQQVRHQHDLETQLAITEEYAYVQQQAIARFKQQIGAATPATASPTTESLTALDAQVQVARLTVQLHQAQQQITQLQGQLTELETQCETAQSDLADKPKLERNLTRLRATITQQDQEIIALQGDAALEQTKAAELEAEGLRLRREAAKWHQSYQDLQQESDRQQTRLTELEQQVAEMQEQILQQARQGSEHELAVQYWQDRYTASQRQIAQLKDLLEQEISHLPPESDIAELLTAMQLALSPDSADPPPSVVPSPQFHTLDLPEFIIRRYRYRTRLRSSKGSSKGSSKL